MKSLLHCTLLFLVSCGPSHKASNENDAVPALSQDNKIIAGKLFSSFQAVNDNHSLRNEVYGSPPAKQLAAGIYRQYQSALESCNSANCLFRNLAINREDSTEMVRLMTAYDVPDASGEITGKSSTSQAIATFNYILKTYLGGVSPRYPKIDAMSFSASDKAIADSIKKSISGFLRLPAARSSFFSLPMLTGLRLLELNGRNEAARYDPPTGGINEPAFARAKNINWSDYDFSVILVPGLGPQSPAIALDQGAARRCDMAVEQFRKGVAAYIMVSGGHVHPIKTKFCEAVEMQKYLVTKHKIPGSSIIIEPHARHTTTNLRNAARLIYRFGIPDSKRVLIVTDVFQATYIPMMTGRFMDELGYLPYRDLTRNKAGQTSFLPDRRALKVNPYDPLDP